VKILQLNLARPEQTSFDEGSWLVEHLLSHDEAERASQIDRVDACHEFVLTRALLRLTLAPLCGMPANALSFRPDARGRPQLASPHVPELTFNISHTRGLVAVLVAPGFPVGVDVEWLDQDFAWEPVAREICGAAELSQLERLPAAERCRRFFESWTLKEAYAKARGLGLVLPFQGVAFERDDTGRWQARFAAAIQDQPDDWRFELQHLPSGQVLASAVRPPAGAHFTIASQLVQIRAVGGSARMEVRASTDAASPLRK